MKRALGAVAGALAVLAGCTLINSGYNECTRNADCSADRVCALRPGGGGYCVRPGCNETYGSTAANAIPLGAALPLTAATPLPDGGVTFVPDDSDVAGLNAIKLAVDEINESGGVGNRAFKLLICDTTGDNTVIAEQVTFLAGQKVPAVITGGSSQTIAAVNAAFNVSPKLLVMSATATSPAITPLRQGDGKDLVWRTAPSDEFQAAVMSRLIKTDARFQGMNRVAIVYVDDAYGRGLEEKLRERLRIPPAHNIVDSLPLKRGANATEVASVGTRLSGLDPDLTVVVLFAADASRLVADARTRANLDRSVHRWFFADAAKDPALLGDTFVRSALDGAFGTAPSQGAGPAFTSFATRYQARHGAGSATAFSFTSHNYDAFYVLALAAASAVGSSGTGELTGATIAGGLEKLSSGTRYQLTPTNFTAAKTVLEAGGRVDVDGASGALQFDANGEAPSQIELWQINTSATPPFVKISDLDP